MVLMDLRMPIMDGCEATRRIRAAHGVAVKIVVLSAGVLAENRQEALAAGADAFMGKPFQEAELLEVIGELAQVKYILHTALVPEPVAPGSPSAEAICRLPLELSQALREATQRAGYDQMLALVDQVAAWDVTLGRQLRGLVERFDYGAIQEILGKEEPEV